LFITPLIPEHLESLLLEFQLPRILLNFPPVGAAVDSVIWDVDDATRQSVRYLTSNGHSRILYFGNASKTRGYRRRWLAFREAMAEAGLPVREEDHMLFVPGTQTEWLDTFKRYMDRVKPTALICATDFDLAWVYYALSEIGLRMPHDVSLIRLDHMHNDFTPDITRPNLLMSESGSRAADRMLWRLANPHLPYEHIRLQCPFFPGNSVRNLYPGKTETSLPL
jgi:LacI family transcriptional regulator